MEFNFYEVEKYDIQIQDKVDYLVRTYNLKLYELGKQAMCDLLLYHSFMRIEVIKKVPTARVFSEEDRQKALEDVYLLISNIVKGIYPTNDITELKKIIDEKERKGLIEGLDLLAELKDEVKKIHKSIHPYLYLAIPEQGLKELVASQGVENALYNRIHNGIYATGSLDSLEQYIIYAASRGIAIKDGKVLFKSIPFVARHGYYLILPKEVSVYRVDIDDFELQLDYRLAPSGFPLIYLHGSEWVANKDRLPCVEFVTDCVRSSYLKHNNVSFVNGDGEVEALDKNMI